MLDAGVVAEALRADVTVTEIRDGYRYEATRGECRAKFDLQGDRINWVSIQSPGGEGWLDDAFTFAREVAPKHGVKFLVADPGTDRARAALESRGFKPSGATLRMDV